MDRDTAHNLEAIIRLSVSALFVIRHVSACFGIVALSTGLNDVYQLLRQINADWYLPPWLQDFSISNTYMGVDEYT